MINIQKILNSHSLASIIGDSESVGSAEELEEEPTYYQEISVDEYFKMLEQSSNAIINHGGK